MVTTFETLRPDETGREADGVPTGAAGDDAATGVLGSASPAFRLCVDLVLVGLLLAALLASAAALRLVWHLVGAVL